MKLDLILPALLFSPSALAEATATPSGAILRSPLFLFAMMGVGMIFMAAFVAWLVKRSSRKD